MRELEKKQKEDEDTTTNNHTGVNSSSSGPHSLIQHTSSNSNHNNSNIHSAAGKSGSFIQCTVVECSSPLEDSISTVKRVLCESCLETDG